MAKEGVDMGQSSDFAPVVRNIHHVITTKRFGTLSTPRVVFRARR